MIHLVNSTLRFSLNRTRLTRSIGPNQSVLPPVNLRLVVNRPLATSIPDIRRELLGHPNMMSATDIPPTDFGHFKLLQSFPVKYAPITLQKWRSERTGLTVVVGSHATPIVSIVTYKM